MMKRKIMSLLCSWFGTSEVNGIIKQRINSLHHSKSLSNS